MYAIRSYYAADGAREAFALTTNPAVVALLERLGFARLARADAPAALAATRQFSARITSYNVCYTKLLRGSGILRP